VNIGNIKNLRPMEELGAVRPLPKFPPAEAPVAPNPQDQVEMGLGLPAPGVSDPVVAEGAAVPQKSISELTRDFVAQVANLKSQSPEDHAYLQEAFKAVDARKDLNSNERKYLFAVEVQAYALQESKEMTKAELKGQPTTPKEGTRFRALADSFGAAKDLLTALEPKVAKPDSTPPTFEAAVPGEGLKAVSGAPAASATPSSAPAPAADGSVPPPAPEPSSDPMVRIWESRRQESQDMANDFKTLLQKTTEWKQRIFASRLAFFWKIYGMRAGYIAESWRK
jgi:hypothetical protein